jgi:hypothetical protein
MHEGYRAQRRAPDWSDVEERPGTLLDLDVVRSSDCHECVVRVLAIDEGRHAIGCLPCLEQQGVSVRPHERLERSHCFERDPTRAGLPARLGHEPAGYEYLRPSAGLRVPTLVRVGHPVDHHGPRPRRQRMATHAECRRLEVRRSRNARQGVSPRRGGGLGGEGKPAEREESEATLTPAEQPDPTVPKLFDDRFSHATHASVEGTGACRGTLERLTSRDSSNLAVEVLRRLGLTVLRWTFLRVTLRLPLSRGCVLTRVSPRNKCGVRRRPSPRTPPRPRRTDGR